MTGYTAITASAIVGLAGQSLGATNTDILMDVAGEEYQQNNGGEFIVRSSLGLASGTAESLSSDTFQSFCLELNESLTIPASYAASINTAAINGGVGGGNPDPLSGETAWLYTQFRNGSLAYAYSGTVNVTTSNGLESFDRDDSARAMQLAIWFLEDEITDFSSQAGSMEERRLAQVYVDLATANGSAFGLGSVRVLNMYDMNGTARQDVLALLIPLPHTAAMGGLALVGLATRRRRALA